MITKITAMHTTKITAMHTTKITAMHTTKITEILTAKKRLGPAAYLWLHDSGDCILWPDEASSEGDCGLWAEGRWQLDKAEVKELIATGECDDAA